MHMRQKKEIEEILRRRKKTEPSEQMTDMIYSLCGVIDSLLWERDKEQEQRKVNIAIDGPCGGGKSTLGAVLQEVYDCNLFHMDDFFLRAEQRTPMRYREPGGNVDYERFKAEVLDHLSDTEGIAYRRFDCGTMSMEESRRIPCNRLNIIEGSYSCHPYFGEVYALRIFVDIDPDRQRERIIARSGEGMWGRFEAEWIPMEHKYFDTFRIREKCRNVRMNL